VLSPQSVTSVSIDVGGGGQGYTAAPNVTITPALADLTGAGATAVANGVSQQLIPKAIQELFTLDYGKMNATMGVEVPFTNFNTQTTIPMGYTDPATEIAHDGETQYWKLTHNGVDTHFMHFHLFTVQIINRIGWDGAIKPPDANELGWKDTVRMNPLEDIVIALRPYNQTLPWDLPNSERPLDPTQKIGTALPNQFTNVDPSNNPVRVVNDMTNFGAEFVWHCHILGHEENDMMRALSFVVAPKDPSNANVTLVPAVVAGPGKTPAKVTVGWQDNAINETGFTIERATLNPATMLFGAWTKVTLPNGNNATPNQPAATEHVTVRQNVTTYTDGTVQAGKTYKYRVTANNVVGYTRQFAAPALGFNWQSGNSAPVETAVVAVP
jgi:hypothetical protein